MKIHYISHHSILEYDEVQLLTDLGHEVFSNGAYLEPEGHPDLPRPGLKGAMAFPDYAQIAREHPAKTDIPIELIAPFDVIIVMHQPDVLVQNWDKFKTMINAGGSVIWRSIGQSTSNIEKKLKPLKDDGLIVVRYSPKEANITDYMGEDAMIRFYKDENVFCDWRGETRDVVNFSQSLKGRRQFCHYDEIIKVIEEFRGTVYGSGNEDLAGYNGGQVPFEQQLEIMKRSRVMVYGGTWPAPYTLSFIEALMLGLPVVAVSKQIAHVQNYEEIDFYEVDEILAECSGVVCDTAEKMVEQTRKLVDDEIHAANISKKQREVAIKHFGKEKISGQWKELLDGLPN